MSIHAFRMFLLYIPSGPQPMGTSKSIPCLDPTWREFHPIFRSNMKKLSFQHTCEQGTVLIGPHLQTWQRFLRWLGNIGNMEWIYLQYAMDWYPNQIPSILYRTSAIPSPHLKRKAATLFFCRVAISLGDPSTRLVDVIVEAAPRFFRLEGGANVGKCSKLLTSLEPLAFSASGLLQMSFFENIEIDMETYLNILGSNSTQTPKHRELH